MHKHVVSEEIILVYYKVKIMWNLIICVTKVKYVLYNLIVRIIKVMYVVCAECVQADPEKTVAGLGVPCLSSVSALDDA